MSDELVWVIAGGVGLVSLLVACADDIVPLRERVPLPKQKRKRWLRAFLCNRKER